MINFRSIYVEGILKMAAAAFSAIIGSSGFNLGAEDDSGWLPLEGRGGWTHEASVSDYPRPQTVITEVPKLTADLSRFTREYVIDLQKFGIANDGTRPVETSNGINQALQYAKKQNANHIIFPKGLYLISGVPRDMVH